MSLSYLIVNEFIRSHLENKLSLGGDRKLEVQYKPEGKE